MMESAIMNRIGTVLLECDPVPNKLARDETPRDGRSADARAKRCRKPCNSLLAPARTRAGRLPTPVEIFSAPLFPKGGVRS